VSEYKEVFVGREKEIDEFFKTLEKKTNPAIVIVGEAGIGKSTFLDEVIRRIREQSNDKKVFVGLNRVLDGTTNPASPFVRVIDDLMSNLTVSLQDKTEGVLKCFKATCTRVFKEKGKTLAKSIAKSIAIKLFDKELVDALGDFADEFTKTSTIDSLAEDIFSKHRDDFVYDYIFFVKTLAETYPDLEFVLVFDQFERAPLLSYGVLLGLIRAKIGRLHVVVCLKMGEESMPNYTKNKPALVELNAKFLTLKPMSEQEIGRWILGARNTRFLDIELKKIREMSGGFPFLISQWLAYSEKLEIDELNPGQEQYCIFIEWCFDGLTEKCSLFLRRISTLTHGLPVADYERLTGEKTGECSLLLQELERKLIFARQEDTYWFRHDLIKPCIEKNLSDSERIMYNAEAADFFEKELNSPQGTEEKRFQWLVDCAYHFQAAHKLQKSLEYNMKCADLCKTIYALDIAEKCYIRILNAAKELDDKKSILEGNLGLARIFITWGRLVEARSILRKLIEAPNELQDKKYYVTALHTLGIIEQLQGNIKEAKQLYNESLKIRQEIGDKRGIAQTTHNLAAIEQDQGNIKEAKQLYNESLKIRQEIGDKRGIAQTTHNLAAIEQDQGNIKEAKQLYNESLKIRQEIGDKRGIAKTTHNLAAIEHGQGNLMEAKQLYNESLKIKQEIGDKRGIAKTTHNLAMVEHGQGNLMEAKRLYNESLKLEQEIGDKQGIAQTIHQLAVIEHGQGNLMEAKRLYNESLKLEQEIGDKQGIAQTTHNLAAIEQDQGNLMKAKHLCYEILKIEQEIGDMQGIAATIHQLAMVEQGKGNLMEAKRLYNESLKIRQEIDDKQGIAQTTYQLAIIEHMNQNFELSLSNFLYAAYLFNQLFSPYEKISLQCSREVASKFKDRKLEQVISELPEPIREYAQMVLKGPNR